MGSDDFFIFINERGIDKILEAAIKVETEIPRLLKRKVLSGCSFHDLAQLLPIFLKPMKENSDIGSNREVPDTHV